MKLAPWHMVFSEQLKLFRKFLLVWNHYKNLLQTLSWDSLTKLEHWPEIVILVILLNSLYIFHSAQ